MTVKKLDSNICSSRPVRAYQIVQTNGSLDHGVNVNAPIELLVLALGNKNDR